MKGLIVVPAFNEEKVIDKVLFKIPRAIDSNKLDILVIDDGSTDNTADKVLKSGRAILVSHPVNRGLGAALGTGFEFARLNDYDFLVTLDADGQHDPNEVSKLLKPILDGQADFVFGSRFFQKGMPLSRRVITFLASIATFLLTGYWTSDSQAGFRAFSRQAIEKIFIEVNRMEVSSDFFRQARENNLRIKEVAITPIYTDYSVKKGQNYLNSANIVGKLILRKLMK